MRFKPPIKLLMGLLLLGGCLLSAWILVPRSKTNLRDAFVPRSRAQIVEMLGMTRPFEGRLVGMDHAAFDPSKARQPFARGLLKKALKVIKCGRDVTEAERLSNAGLVYGLGAELDRGIQELSRATASKGSKLWMWSDLAALYMERYRRSGDSKDLLRALDSSARGNGSRSVSLEARFNHALSLEKLSLFALAQSAWRSYIALDPHSPWTCEAEAHLKIIEGLDVGMRWNRARRRLEMADSNSRDIVARDITREFPQFSREYGEENLLGAWATNLLAGNSIEAERALSSARQIGHELGANVGEHMLEDSVAVIDQAIVVGGSDATDLARVHSSYQRALAESSRVEYSRCETLFRKVGQEFEALGSPFFRWARLRMAACQYQGSKYELAIAVLQRINSLSHSERYPALTGTTYWTLGLIRGIEGDPAESLGFYQTSLQSFERAKEEENCAKAWLLMAECLRYLGNLQQAWSYSWQSLQKVAYIQNSRKRYGVISEAASLAEALVLPEAALNLMDEALQTPMDADPAGRAAAYLGRATLYAGIGRSKDAQESLAVAFQLLQHISNLDSRSMLRGDLLVVEGRILAHTSLDAAMAQLSQAVDLYQHTSYIQQLNALLVERAEIETSLHRPDLAEEDLKSAIDGIEKERENTPERNRESLLDESRKAYDEMARVQSLLGRKSEAFRYIEKSRSRFLLDHMAASGDFPLRLVGSKFLSRLQKNLARNTVLVEYHMSGSSLSVWVISGSEASNLQLGSSIEELGESVKLFRDSLSRERSDTDFRVASAALFDRLIRPILPRIEPAEEVVFVPDGVLYEVSFPALLNRNSGHFIVQDFAVVISPSAMVHAMAARVKRAVGVGSAPSNVLAVGDPVIERRVWSSVPNLDDTELEVKEVAQIYPVSHLLVREKATPANFLKIAPSFQVIHLAAHAIVDTSSPLLSLFILSPSQGAVPGALYARDIGRQRFRSTRLVVLNACGSLGAHIGRTEGLSGLATSFLQAGVPTVVGTLWRVDDARSRRFAGLLHRWVRKGVDPASALRSAQIESLQSTVGGTKDLSWASFEAFGT